LVPFKILLLEDFKSKVALLKSQILTATWLFKSCKDLLREQLAQSSCARLVLRTSKLRISLTSFYPMKGILYTQPKGA